MTSRSHRGFTLIEMMIAMLLGAFIILGITTLFTEASSTVTDVNRMHRQLENSLFATDLISSELSLAGYWGEAGNPIDAKDPTYGPLRGRTDTDGFPLAPVPACIGTGRTGLLPTVELGWGMEHALVSGNGATLASELASNACEGSFSTPSTNAFFALRRASTCACGQDDCTLEENAYYIQTNGCFDESIGWNGGEIDIKKVNTSTVGTELTYKLYGCTTTAPVYNYVSNIYYVNSQEQLVRLYFDKTKYVEEMLVEGVEHLSFEWYIDTDGDLEHDTVVTQLTPEYSKRVRGIKIWLVVRGLKPIEEYTDTNTYLIAGNVWEPPASSINYPRILKTHMVDVSRVVTVQRKGRGKGGRK